MALFATAFILVINTTANTGNTAGVITGFNSFRASYWIYYIVCWLVALTAVVGIRTFKAVDYNTV
jgi:hypothetical protein